MINKQAEASIEEGDAKAEKEETKLTKEVSKKEEQKKDTLKEDKELLEKLMLDEDKEEGAVGFHVWKAFFSYYGGWFFYFFLFIVMIVMAVSQAGSNFWLSYWSENGENHTKSYYFGIYTALGTGYAVFAFIRTIMLRVQAVRFSRYIHREMFSKIIRAPVNLFFDRVPMGRILNRFSKDLTVIDDYLSGMFGFVMTQLFAFLTDIVVCVIIGTAWVFPLAMLFFYICYRLRITFAKINREVSRLSGITKSPIVSFFSESLAGLTSIRTYNEQSTFLNKFHKLQDENIKNNILEWAVFNWYHLRTTFASVVIIGPVISITLLFSGYDTVSAGLVALLIIYVIEINDDISHLFLMSSDFEFQLISLERCKKFTEVEGEAPAKTKEPERVQNMTSNWPARGSIEFRNYFVKYRPNLPHVIDNLSVSINSGEKNWCCRKNWLRKVNLLLISFENH